MFKKLSTISITFLLLGLLVSCNSEYRSMVKKAKSNQFADLDSAAIWFYTHKKYDRAVPILEQLTPIYAGQERQQLVYYYYAWSRYFLGEMVSAAYYFEDFGKKFPGNEHAEECEFMVAKCYYILSDPYQLDQTYTDRALDQMQLFLSRHPSSEKEEEGMIIIRDLRERRAKKAFEQATLYYNITYYKAAVEAFQIMINEFPDSDFREEAQFMLFKSAYSLASASTERKKVGRYEEALNSYEKFADKFPESKFGKEAENLRDETKQSMNRLKAEKIIQEQESLYSRFQTQMDVVLKSKDPEARKDSYEKALELYKELKDKHPGSDYITKADAKLAKLESKEDI